MTNYSKRELKDLDRMFKKISNIEGYIAKLNTELQANHDRATQRKIKKNIQSIHHGISSIIKDEERITENACLQKQHNVENKWYLRQSETQLIRLETALDRLYHNLQSLSSIEMKKLKEVSSKLNMAKLIIEKANASRKYASAS